MWCSVLQCGVVWCGVVRFWAVQGGAVWCVVVSALWQPGMCCGCCVIYILLQTDYYTINLISIVIVIVILIVLIYIIYYIIIALNYHCLVSLTCAVVSSCHQPTFLCVVAFAPLCRHVCTTNTQLMQWHNNVMLLHYNNAMNITCNCTGYRM